MPAAILDIAVNQNATYKTGFTLGDGSGSYVNITNWDFSASISPAPNAPPTAVFTIVVTSVPSASIDVTLPAHEAEKLTATKYRWDLIAVNKNVTPFEVYRLLEGKVAVSPGVTHS